MNDTPPVRLILDAVAAAFDVPLREILSPRKTEKLMRARTAAYGLCFKMTAHSHAQIGMQIGGRDHTTVINGIGRFYERNRSDDDFRQRVEAARAAIEIMNASRLAARFGGGDPVAIATYVNQDPYGRALMLSVEEIAALAARVLAAEAESAALRTGRPDQETSHGEESKDARPGAAGAADAR